MAAVRTALDTGQRLLVPRGLGWAVDWLEHAIPTGSAAAFIGGVAGARRNFDSTARKPALGKNCGVYGGTLRGTAVALDDSKRCRTARISATGAPKFQPAR